MKENKTKRIDFSEKRLGNQADKLYNEGDYITALSLTYKQYGLYGGSGDIYVRFADIYEGLGLHLSAINWWYKFLDEADEEDYPDIYEGLAVNYLNLGKEAESAYYYNRLIDVDESISSEIKMEIVNAFAKDKRSKFRFVYPPKLADYSREIELGSHALKAGKGKTASKILERVEKGSKEYAEAMEMRAVACLLAGEVDEAETICKELLQEKPSDTRVLATLSAVYLEQGKKEESLALALRLYKEEQESTDDLYKVATVCCENGLHKEAFEKFTKLSKKIPYDGRMLYFKGVSAYKSGLLEESERAFDTLCTIYPDAEVAKFYLKGLRTREETNGESLKEPSYFYHVPQEEREARCRSLIHIGKCPKDEAQLFALIALHDGYFRWCFDELDGEDHDLQYLAIVTAEHVHADDFLREVLLDPEVLDALKVELIRLLIMRNEDAEFGLVLCNMYRRISLMKIKLGKKRRKRFLEGYAGIASKFIVVNETYGKRLKISAEKLYEGLEKYDGLDLIENANDVSCALYMLSDFKEFGRELTAVAGTFEADEKKVLALLSKASGEITINEEKQDEIN